MRSQRAVTSNKAYGVSKDHIGNRGRFITRSTRPGGSKQPSSSRLQRSKFLPGHVQAEQGGSRPPIPNAALKGASSGTALCPCKVSRC